MSGLVDNLAPLHAPLDSFMLRFFDEPSYYYYFTPSARGIFLGSEAIFRGIHKCQKRHAASVDIFGGTQKILLEKWANLCTFHQDPVRKIRDK